MKVPRISKHFINFPSMESIKLPLETILFKDALDSYFATQGSGHVQLLISILKICFDQT